MRPILVTGKMGAGKNMVAQILINKYGFKKHSMAGWIKRTIANHYLYGLENPEFDKKNVFNGMSARSLMQKLGNAMRNIDENWHVKECTNEIDRCRHNDCFIIDDIRFENEILQLKQFNPIVVKVECNHSLRLERFILRDMYVPTESELFDISESNIDDLPHDILITNNSTPLDLAQNLIEQYETFIRTNK